MNPRRLPSTWLAWSLAIAVVAPAQAAVLRCQVRYASETVLVEARPAADPYTVAAHDIAGRFRFKAVLVAGPQGIDHIALYTYDMDTPQAPQLVHEVVYQAPFQRQIALPGLTGWHHIYSAKLGREMVYGCGLDLDAS